jgi:LemA protein
MFLVFLSLIIAIGLYGYYIYHDLTGLKEKIDNEWGSICASLIERFKITKELMDKNPNLDFNYQEVNELMDSLQKVTSKEEFLTGYQKYEEKVKELITKVNNETNIEMINNLNDASNKIEYIKKFYNEDVQKYNKKLEVFPSNLVASVCKFNKDVIL